MAEREKRKREDGEEERKKEYRSENIVEKRTAFDVIIIGAGSSGAACARAVVGSKQTCSPF